MSRRKTRMIGGDEFFRLSSGKMVNISELLRIDAAVEAAVKPGMSEAEIDQIIAATVKRLSPN